MSTSLKLTRVSSYDFDRENPLVLTFPEISYCKRTAVIKLKCNARAVIENRAEKKTFMLDNVKFKKGQAHFYYQKKLVLSVWDEGWCIKAEQSAAEAGLDIDKYKKAEMPE